MDTCILCEKSLKDGRLKVGLRQKGCDGVTFAPFPVRQCNFKIVVEITAIREELTRRK